MSKLEKHATVAQISKTENMRVVLNIVKPFLTKEENKILKAGRSMLGSGPQSLEVILLDLRGQAQRV
jgi:hypothetical protein